MSKKTKEQQLEFGSVLEESFKSHERRMEAYMVATREKYLGFARFINSETRDRDYVFSRIAFAILSANTPFEDSIKALNYVLEHKGHVQAIDLAEFKCVPAKAKYVNDLYHKLNAWEVDRYLKIDSESWSEYRYRLQSKVKGLGIAKASFAACLLYPLEADLACIDTWMQKVFLRRQGFRSLGKQDYEKVEAKVRKYARRHGVSTFIAQWQIWDHARGNMNNHAIFPGSHKKGE